MRVYEALGRGRSAMLEEVLNRIGQIQEGASVKTVFGDPYQVNGRTVVPVARFAYWFGFGGGRGQGKAGEAGDGRTGEGTGAGGGGLASVRPIAVLEISGAQTAVKPIVDVTRLALAGMALLAWNVFWITYTVRRVRGRRSED